MLTIRWRSRIPVCVGSHQPKTQPHSCVLLPLPSSSPPLSAVLRPSLIRNCRINFSPTKKIACRRKTLPRTARNGVEINARSCFPNNNLVDAPTECRISQCGTGSLPKSFLERRDFEKLTFSCWKSARSPTLMDSGISRVAARKIKNQLLRHGPFSLSAMAPLTPREQNLLLAILSSHILKKCF